MIKILFFIETIDGGGAEKVLRNLVNNMDQNKFDITVQTVWPCEAEKYLKAGIHYKSMYKKMDKWNIMRYRLEAATGLAYPMHMKDDYDIECAYLECGATKLLAGSTNKKSVKLAWVHCDLKKLMEDPEGFARETRKYYERYDKVICVSQKGRQSFEELFGKEIETDIVYNTVDCEEIMVKADEETKDLKEISYPLAVSLGRLSTPKHYIRLLRVHKKLIDSGVMHKLLIIGEGPERTELEAYIKEYGLENTLELPGFKSNPYPYLKKADVLVCSSLYECFSTFITEGIILGKAIVTTDASGMREILGDSEYGLITEHSDNAFYEGLKQMLLDAEMRRDFEQKAVIRGKDFSTKKLVEQTEQFFIKSLESRR